MFYDWSYDWSKMLFAGFSNPLFWDFMLQNTGRKLTISLGSLICAVFILNLQEQGVFFLQNKSILFLSSFFFPGKPLTLLPGTPQTPSCSKLLHFLPKWSYAFSWLHILPGTFPHVSLNLNLLQSHISYCPCAISSWMSQRHFKLMMLKINSGFLPH